jgi:hypothetical protein
MKMYYYLLLSLGNEIKSPLLIREGNFPGCKTTGIDATVESREGLGESKSII